jgi:carbonic anhydrase
MNNKKPNTLFICCCDHRIFPYKITEKEEGELFILRNIGNLIPPHGAKDSSVGAALEYAVGTLGVSEIIICGHSDCGGMKATLAGVGDSNLKEWLEYAVPAEGVLSADELSQANVLHQINNVMTYPVVRKQVAEGKLKIYGWWVDLESGEVKIG